MLEQFNTLLTDLFGPFGPLLLVGILGLFMVLLTVPTLMNRKPDPLDKIKENATGITTGKKDREKLRNGGNDKLEKYSDFLEPQDEEEFSAVRLKLMQAGYRTKNAVRTYYFAQFALGLGLLVLGMIYAFISSATGEPTTQSLILATLLPACAGYMLPKYWVQRRLQTRQEEIINGFPDSLDMMLVCVEAGQSLDQSIVRVASEIRAGYPALADEFDIVAQEMKAGKDKNSVLEDMSERAGVQDVTSFVTVLKQSNAFGTSIAEALRVYASEMRDKRVMRAEEKANTLPTKMTLATMMLTVPPLLIILIGPSVYGIYEMMNNANF